MKKIFVIGGTGFIGSHLISKLLKEDFEIYVLARNKEKAKKIPSPCKVVLGDPTKEGDWQNQLNTADIVINLAGQNIFSRWNENYKKLILESRVKSTENIVSFLKNGAFLVNAGAIGYYGDKGETLVTEDSPPGDDFFGKSLYRMGKKCPKG
uniref:NAD-dependent epimerase/dehydratase family protein n=1 Tax=Thermodesulfobacterium geofontis TaxID=1295609 RepID=A0A7C4NRV8_9BACT